MTETVPPITIRELFNGINHRFNRPADALKITGMTHDSRKVRPGDLFVALKGHKQDGHDKAMEAVRAGAAAVVAERVLGLTVPVAVVSSTQKVLSTLAARFYRFPSRDMTIVGVTGTNGKTTITYMLESIFSAAGLSSGVMGTVNYRWKNTVEKAPNTTPLALELQQMLYRMKSEGVTHVAMEVSSHSLVLDRVDDVSFSTAVFTNLTRDHLDFHKTMEDYFFAKALLFDILASSVGGAKNKCAIINRDDAWADKFLSRVKTQSMTYGLKSISPLSAVDLKLNATGTSFSLIGAKGRFPFRLNTVGTHNIYNALAAAGAALSLGIPMEKIQKGLEGLAGIPGRLERVTGPKPMPFQVFVDYAHTDDALRNVLDTLRPLTARRLITVFGCGGDRDRTKRPLMGAMATKKSDHVVVTSDNPRTEDPSSITADIEEGIRGAGNTNYEVVLDRAEAIRKALLSAREGDVVLIAGKGHETYQIFKDRTIDFDDREAARAIMRTLA